MKRPWWIALPLAWMGVVAIVALLAWWVIDGAGQSILTEPAHDAVTPVPTAGPAAPESSGRGRGRTSDPTPDPTTGSTETGPPTQPPASSAPPTAPQSTPQPTQQSTQHSTQQPPQQSDGPDPVTRTSTWQGDAGLLRVSCTGPTLRLEGASPHDGYVVEETEREGGRELEVKFRSTDGAHEVEIHVVCVGGVPDFTVEQSGSDD